MYPSGEHEDVTGSSIWGTRVSPGSISNLNKKIHGESFLIKNHYSYVYLDGIWMRVENVSVLLATVESMERVSGRFPATSDWLTRLPPKQAPVLDSE